jgi:serine/threonine-protein kinase
MSTTSFTSEVIRRQVMECETELRQPGTVLFSQGRYEIQRMLGEGGMGITCLADEISVGNLRRPVVLKFVKDSLAPQQLSQFLNEAQLSILFNHPNIVPVYRLESEVLKIESPRAKTLFSRTFEHTVYFTVMQYIDGWNVRQIVDRLRALVKSMNQDMAVYLIGRICRGLHYVHHYCDANGAELGLVHRDVSPENILVDHFGRIKVADFGITTARKQGAAETQGHAGKLLYCSPEQLEGKPLDPRSDIYCVGLLMYFLFTDTDWFGPELKSSKPRDRIRRKMKKSPLPGLAHVNPRLASICAVCLRENPSERYQTCEDMATDLDIFFKDSHKIVTNDMLEEFLSDLFSANPTFVSRRFIPLTGTPHLDQPQFNPNNNIKAEDLPAAPATLKTVKILPGEGG